MVKRWIKRALTALVALAVASALVYSFLPQPVAVDTARVTRGKLQVVVEEDGKTRIRERYVVSAPLGGRLQRIHWREGDRIVGTQPLAIIEPSDPALLDARARAEAEARVKAAKAALDRATANISQVHTLLEYAENELARAQQLSRDNAITQQELDERAMLRRIRNEEYRQAQHAENVAKFELELARAALIRTRPQTNGTPDLTSFEIPPPPLSSSSHSLYVLRVLQESETIVTPGTQLLELGDPSDLEIEIDVLSSDAVKIHSGAPVILEQWGGDYPLHARVRLVEPSGFLKISALGVEEQRVNVIADFVSPDELPDTLRDAFRVEAKIVIWEKEDCLKVPNSALFRHDEKWSVFRVQDGRAVQQEVEVGRRSALEAEILGGLTEGDTVVVHPSDKVHDGVAIKPR